MTAKADQPDLARDWVQASFQVGSNLPDSLLTMTIQRAGDLDILLRSFEASASNGTSVEASMFNFNYQAKLSELWIGRVYAVFATVDRARRRPSSAMWSDLATHVTRLRVAFEKHQIAHDLGRTMWMQRVPAKPDEPPLIYDGTDSERSIILPSGISSRGSCTWMVTDPKRRVSYWVERLDISQRVLRLWTLASRTGDPGPEGQPLNAPRR